MKNGIFFLLSCRCAVRRLGGVGFFGEFARERFACEHSQPALLALRFGGGDPFLAELFFARVERLAFGAQLVESGFGDRLLFRLPLFPDRGSGASCLALAASARGYRVFDAAQFGAESRFLVARLLLLLLQSRLFFRRLQSRLTFFFLSLVQELFVSRLLLLDGRFGEREVGDDFLEFERGADPLHRLAVKAHEEIRESREQARADGDEYDYGDYRLSHFVVIENGVVRDSRVGVGDESVAFIDESEDDGRENVAYRGDHALEVLGKAFDAHSRLILLRVQTVGHDRGLDYVLRSVGEVEDEQRDDKKDKAALEREEHDGGGYAVGKAEGESRLARSELIDQKRSQDHARSEADGDDGLGDTLETAVAQLIGADPGEQRDERSLETVEKSGDGDRPKLSVFGEYLHAVDELDLVDVHLGNDRAFLRVIKSEKAHQEGDDGEYRHEYAVSPDVHHGVRAEEDAAESGQSQLDYAGTEIAQKFGEAEDLRTFGGVGTYDLRQSHLRVARKRLGDAEQIIENTDEHYLQYAQRFGGNTRRVKGNDRLFAGDQPCQSDDGDDRGNARPDYVRTELAYGRVGVVEQHADEGSLDHADDVGDDEQIHQIARAEPVDRSGEQAGRGHLNVLGHQIAVTFESHASHAERGDLFVGDFLSSGRALPIAANDEQCVL